MSRPNLLDLKTWKSHEDRVLEVFQNALLRLGAARELPEREDDLNRKLFLLARKENYRLIRRGRGTHSNLYYEACNQPAADDAERAGREAKIPDFQCGFVDAQEGVDRFLAIEGKRLGKPSSSGWVLNENYVNNGVRRFVNSEWAYGEDAESGAMVGYIQTMDFGSILNEVTQSGSAISIPVIATKARRSRGSVITLEHVLQRPFPESPFALRHFWVDLRRSAKQAKAKVA
jgi:hypothetical protein